MADFSWANVPGYFNFQNIYDRAVKEAPTDRPSLFVEVGVFFGRSLFYLAEAVKKSGKPISIEAIDPFFKGWTRGACRELYYKTLKETDPYPDTRCQEPVFLPSWWDGDLNEVLPQGLMPGTVAAAQQLGLDHLISFWMGRAQRIYHTTPVDFVFFDAQHTYEDTLELLMHYLPRMSKGGVIAGHDFVSSQYPGVKQAVEQIFSCDYKVVGMSFVHRVKGSLTTSR